MSMYKEERVVHQSSDAEGKAGYPSSAIWDILKPRPFSCAEFKSLVNAFQAATAQATGMPITLDIRAAGRNPMSDREEENYILGKTNDLNALTDENWPRIDHVDVLIHSTDQSRTTHGSVACFSQKAKVSFFVDAKDKDVSDVKQTVLAARPRGSVIG